MKKNNKHQTNLCIGLCALLLAATSYAENEILITPYDGSAYVSGYVTSDNQAVVLEQLLEALPSLDNPNTENVNIGESRTPLPDEMLTAKINGGFMRAGLFGTDANFSDITIKVETNDGIVTLSGYAENERQLANAIAIAKLVAGVKKVESAVTVNAP